MMLMPAALEVVPEHIAAGDVWIATGVDGEIAANIRRIRSVTLRHRWHLLLK
jgi:hypothetical protein